MRKPIKPYINANGYIEGEKYHSHLLSRQIAYEHIYLKNRDKYPLPFKEYIVHHKDKHKLNNDISNLQILTPKEHEKIHGRYEPSKEELNPDELDKFLDEISISSNSGMKETNYLTGSKKYWKVFTVILILFLIIMWYIDSTKKSFEIKVQGLNLCNPNQPNKESVIQLIKSGCSNSCNMNHMRYVGYRCESNLICICK